MCLEKVGGGYALLARLLATPGAPHSISTHSYSTRENFIQAALSPDVQGKMGCSLRVVYPAPGAYDSSKVIFLARIIHGGSSRNCAVAKRDRRAGRETGQHPAWEFRRGCAPFMRISQAGCPLVEVGDVGFKAVPARGGSNLP